MSSLPPTPPTPAMSAESVQQWRERVVRLQQQRSPQEVQEVRERAARQRRAQQSLQRASLMQRAQKLTTRSAGSAMRSFSASPQFLGGASPALRNERQLSAVSDAMQSSALAPRARAKRAPASNLLAPPAPHVAQPKRARVEAAAGEGAEAGSDDEEGEEEGAAVELENQRVESAMQMLDAVEHEMEEEERASGAVAANADGDLEGLLEQLKHEPRTDPELAAKFALFERYHETVQTSRSHTLEFWEANKDQFDGAPLQHCAKLVADIDAQEHMGALEQSGVWFVFYMARQVHTNTQRVERVLATLSSRLAMLANQNLECPMCLEPLAAPNAGDGEQPPAPQQQQQPEGAGAGGKELVRLGCCHAVCAECWATWNAMRHGHAFCPLCRHDEFLGAVLQDN